MEAVRAIRAVGYDAVLMDCKMPEMDGFEATKEIRQSGNLVPIIALTANAFADNQMQCLRAGMNDFIVKPVTPERLVGIMDLWTASGRGGMWVADAGRRPARSVTSS